jgi:hypothetical protein
MMISVSNGPGAAGYRGLFGQAVLHRLAVAVADVCARLPQGMVSLTPLLAATALTAALSAHHDPFGRK